MPSPLSWLVIYRQRSTILRYLPRERARERERLRARDCSEELSMSVGSSTRRRTHLLRWRNTYLDPPRVQNTTAQSLKKQANCPDVTYFFAELERCFPGSSFRMEMNGFWFRFEEVPSLDQRKLREPGLDKWLGEGSFVFLAIDMGAYMGVSKNQGP